MVIEPDSDTVEVVLDTAWRAAASEWTQTDSLDRKAASVATFAALAVALATSQRSDSAVRASGLVLLLGAVAAAVWALLPKERRVLGLAYLDWLTRWPQLMRGRTEIEGDLAVTLLATIAVERAANRRKMLAVRASFTLLFLGLAVIAAGASIVSLAT
jgi:hypothetical protein